MHLSLQTDFALRILMALGTSGQQMSVEEISRRYNVSRNHLAKVAHRLQTLGLVKATRGRGGGLSLARPPEDINVGEVVRAMENLGNFVECMQASSNGCPVAGACGLQGALTRALQDFLRRLDQYQLADLTPNRQRFANLLAESGTSEG
ncbi:Rrf2 family transcriptional regulator [uncultured Sphingorhabdus sp.]|jgi:Rrf2 family nitric oxide-sensitive transcriptional repressor|uniref:RrF2 family transcriptional regulator n=1 Tax=uncultured Sphingorhabdus sp. TaxID=1686106 RepID=UPI00262CEA2F|nr:Rrf2 family transcriptional regulator [uncultured Sphingorhabdus sp.]HMS21999.1 Rrf2 family transcriptional regulator [Sphingorhabdus sp.]